MFWTVSTSAFWFTAPLLLRPTELRILYLRLGVVSGIAILLKGENLFVCYLLAMPQASVSFYGTCKKQTRQAVFEAGADSTTDAG
jgi:hypothetical protein